MSINLSIVKAEYGNNYNYINITDKVKEYFFKDDKLLIPKGTELNELFTDPCIGISKEIHIFASINNNPIYICEKEQNNYLLNDIFIDGSCYSVISIIKAEYGINDNYINITDKVKKDFLKYDKLFIPKETNLNELFTDPCIGVSKKINIVASINNNPIYICEKEENNCLSNDIFIDKYTYLLQKFNIENYDSEDFDKNNVLYYGDNISIPLNDKNKKYSIIQNINDLKSFILIIDFPKLGGGTTHFLNTIIQKYKYHQTFLIVRNINNLNNIYVNDEYILEDKYTNNSCIYFLKNNINKIDKIFVNHILNHSDYFIEEILNLNKEKTYITHDFFLLFNNPQPLYEDIIKNKYIKNNIYINKFDKIITQNIENLNFFETFLDNNKKVIITELPDYKKTLNRIETTNSHVVIGIIGDISDIKGRKIINKLNNFIIKNNYNMEIIIFGNIFNLDMSIKYFPYKNIDELNNLLITYKPNVLLDCSLWPETYSYTTTLSIITQLPIISLKKNFHSVIHNRLLKYNKVCFFDDIQECLHIALIKKQNYFYTISPNIYFNSFWDNYFITKKQKKPLLNSFKYDINPYFIYFPQFHNIIENNINFYDGYTDANNLKLLINDTNYKTNYNDIDIPSFNDLEINDFDDYDLTNIKLVQKQIDIISDYNISGFAIYYYWFSTNTITNQNTIMDKVINNFFDDRINLKNKDVFFIWANESWTKSKSFGNTNDAIIDNQYNVSTIRDNVKNLIKYFKHKNYLKIDNKPVFFIYHPFFMNNTEIDLFYEMLNTECINNSFSGVHLVLNSFMNKYEKYNNFYINFNYKYDCNQYYYDNNEQIKVLDYQKYLNNDTNFNDVIQTVVFDFDSRVRMYKPNKLQLSNICVNNTELNKIIFTNKILNTYENKDNKLDKILLVNAFNEWGEKMCFEPSQQYGFYNLNILNDCLTAPEKTKKNIVLVTSKIIVSDNSFSYYKIRSSYDTNTRFLQTLETIETIRKYIPNSFIVLIDNSNLNIEMTNIIEKRVDNFINIIDDNDLNYYTDISPYKAFGDISQQIKFYDMFLKNFDINNIQNFFKISGRYLINDDFDYFNFDNNKNVMKQNDLILNIHYYFTCFYKISTNDLYSYFYKLKEIIKNEELYYNKDCETLIYEILYNNLKNVSRLGITQRIAIIDETLEKFNDKFI